MNNISPGLILLIIGSYFLLLIGVSFLTSIKADNNTFFTANKNSPWYLVAFGMIGASLSGVTFISLPGVVGANGYNQDFSYMQMVLGYLVGYFIIATVLMPIYYRLNLTSIYGYLGERFGPYSKKIASGFFLLSRSIGASLRLYLVAIILQKFLMDALGVPYFVTVLITIILIWVYTYRGGIKTIVVTDTLQTVCMLVAVGLTIWYISDYLDISGISGIISTIDEQGYGQFFFFEGGWNDPNNFWKQFISGALIAIVMTGLDQDMMQKNLTCRNLGDAQKNIFAFSFVLIFANLMFLALGALLYIYAESNGIQIPDSSDQIFATIALENLPAIVGVFFFLGLIAAAYSSADSALTSLTTAFCIDFLNFENRDGNTENLQKTRLWVHVGFSLLLFVIIVLFKYLIDIAAINALFKAAGYTYGPILGLFTYGIVFKRKIKDKWVILVCILSPIVTYLLDSNAANWFNGFQFGNTIIALNGILTMIGLWIISKKIDLST
jgi:Na+/proline symporter